MGIGQVSRVLWVLYLIRVLYFILRFGHSGGWAWGLGLVFRVCAAELDFLRVRLSTRSRRDLGARGGIARDVVAAALRILAINQCRVRACEQLCVSCQQAWAHTVD